MTPILTDHGEHRLRHRIGFPKRAIPRMVRKALGEGRLVEAFGGELRKYLHNVYRSVGTVDNIRVMGEVVYLFASDILSDATGDRITIDTGVGDTE
jgi:hypothetical protein